MNKGYTYHNMSIIKPVMPLLPQGLEAGKSYTFQFITPFMITVNNKTIAFAKGDKIDGFFTPSIGGNDWFVLYHYQDGGNNKAAIPLEYLKKVETVVPSKPKPAPAKFKVGDKVVLTKDWRHPIVICEMACPECMDAKKGTKATITSASTDGYGYGADIEGCGGTGMIDEEYLEKASFSLPVHLPPQFYIKPAFIIGGISGALVGTLVANFRDSGVWGTIGWLLAGGVVGCAGGTAAIIIEDKVKQKEIDSILFGKPKKPQAV